MRTAAIVALTATLATSTGCFENREPLTTGEALQALEEAAVSSQASNLVSGSIEITTDFTIGGAVESAAEEIRTFVETQLPCAEVTVTGPLLEIEYGAKPGNCEYRGHTYSGTHAIEVEANEEGSVIVSHRWDELSNGLVSVTGDATVTWSLSEQSRRVEHELTWTSLTSDVSGTGSGDRTQTALNGNLAEGIQVDGERGWTGQRGTWTLDIDAVQMRWADPVPQSGTYTLVNPDDKRMTLSFERLDGDTITVTIAGTKRSFSFDVTAAGQIGEGA